MGITEFILNYNLIAIEAQGKGIGSDNLSTKFKFKAIAIT